MGFALVLNGVAYGVGELPSVAVGELSPNQWAAVEFCRLWLSGVEEIVLHTSGSTGTPKPVQLTRAQMSASARATLDALQIEPGMRALLCLPAHYVAGCMMLVRAMVGALTIEVVEPASNPLAEGVESFDFTALVPLQLESILDAGRESLRLLEGAHAVLIGGATVSVRLEERVQALTAPLYHTYGMTETVSHVALRRMNGLERSEFFTPQRGVELGLDERGCLRIRAPMSNNRWVQTNDVVELLGDGRFRWLGRIDNVINSGGIKVQVERVESALETLLEPFFPDDLPRYFVTGVEDERLGQKVALVIEGAPLELEVETALIEAMREVLGAYETPRVILHAAPFVLTPTGKIDRSATRANAQAAKG